MLCVCITVSGQGLNRSVGNLYTLFPQGYVMSQLGINGMCAAAAQPTTYGLPDNPAVVSGNQRWAIGMSAQSDTKIEEAWIADIGMQRPQERSLQSAGLFAPLGPITLGIGYAEQYLYELKLQFERHDVNHPEGTGEFITLTTQSRIYSTGVVAGYKSVGLIGRRSQVDFGVGYYVNNMGQSAKFNSSTEPLGKMDDKVNSWSVGVHAKVPIGAVKFVDLGLYYDSGAIISKRCNQSADTSRETNWGDDICYNGDGGLPPRVVAGCAINLTEGISILGDVQFISWSKFPFDYHDAEELSFTIVYSGLKQWQFSFGSYATERPREDDHYFSSYQDFLTAIYLTAGIERQFKHLTVGISLADSHRYSGHWREQTIMKLTTSYRL